ncbi:hypothetical protein BC941DRAFT_467422 [Chlamydoabsidia padenii]|nr:hypothetical protein BC941DRAFT_467422 [Chlamydoabsidia padenii]
MSGMLKHYCGSTYSRACCTSHQLRRSIWFMGMDHDEQCLRVLYGLSLCIMAGLSSLIVVSDVSLCVLVGFCILVLWNAARNDVNDKIMSNAYLERRRRTRFPTFATEAQQWMARYDSLAEFFGYTPVEMVEELQDSNPVMAAVDELKLIKQGKMAIDELASFILLQ